MKKNKLLLIENGDLARSGEQNKNQGKEGVIKDDGNGGGAWII